MSMQAEDHIKAVQTEGYTIIPEFVNSAYLMRIKSALAVIEAASDNCKNEFLGLKTIRAHNLLDKTRDFDDMVIDPLLLTIVEGVLGPHYQVSITAMINIFPGETSQVLHQDDSLWPLARPHPPMVLNTMLAVDPFTKENGATRIVPRSHLATDEVDPEAETISALLSEGALLIWDGALWHGGGANNSDRVRSGLNINYNLAWLRQQENHYLGLKRESLNSMPERLQRLVGYESLFGFVGLVDLQEPLSYMMKKETL